MRGDCDLVGICDENMQNKLTRFSYLRWWLFCIFNSRVLSSLRRHYRENELLNLVNREKVSGAFSICAYLQFIRQ